MLTSFLAQNFRQFTKLELPRLAQVNLFVGRNNVGKSALLEALQVYFSRASGQALMEILSVRAETWDGVVRGSDRPSVGDSVRHLFKGHQLPTVGEKGIVVGPMDNNAQLQLVAAAYQLFNNPDGTRQLLLVDANQVSLFDDFASDAVSYLVAVEGNKTRRIAAFDSPARRLRLLSNGIDELALFQLVPTKSLSPRTVAVWWDAINLTDLEEEVVGGLRVINNLITGVAFVEDTASRSSRIPLARLQGQSERLPLSSMGDGVTRLFHITLALVNAKGGALLIDEFENGLHWSIQEKVWKSIFQLAARLDVQVFATTHSRDCVQAFKAAWEENIGQGAYYRLEASPVGEVRARAYSLETLSDSIDSDIETR